MRVDCDQEQVYQFNARNTALLCIDYQMDFLSESGFSAARGADVKSLRRVIEPARQALASARRAGLMILHTRECYAVDRSNLNPFRRVRDAVIGTQGPLGRFLLQGEGGTTIIPELAPLPSEPIVDKPGLNAFYSTDLDARLRDREITHLILMGVTTQVCVASTLRGAVDRGYFPLLLSDCCAAYDREDHEATLRVIFSENHQFGWISDSIRLTDTLE